MSEPIQQPRYSMVIEWSDMDPSDVFILRFQDVTALVRKVSQCRTTMSGVTDSATGKPGLVFTITAIHRRESGTANVEGGYYEGDLSSSGNTYHVVRTSFSWQNPLAFWQRPWTVTGDTMHWIS